MIATKRDEELRQLEEVFSGRRARVLRQLRSRRKRWMWLTTLRLAQIVKRTLDIVVSLGMIVVLSPLFALLALCIWATDRGPVLFWQTRVGQFGQEFRFPKFRSMVVNAEAVKDKLLQQNQHNDNKTFKMKNDPRITWIGKFLRKLSLDEMPQLWCVLKGEMALVGPRPPVPREVALYTITDRRRLEVRPGLTCIWQVSGRSEIPFEGQVKLDAEYIESQSVWLDIVLLFKTIPAVLLGKGAY